MFALDRRNRTALSACALAAFAGSFVTAPFAARGQWAAEANLAGRDATVATAAPATFAVVVPRRDPFAGEPPPVARPSAAASATATLPLPPMPAIPGAIRPLPPNAGAAGTVLPFAPQARVTALITGTHPYALVEDAGTTRVVTTGDKLDGDTIVAIGTGGVRLARGTLLPVAPQSSLAEPIPGGRLP